MNALPFLRCVALCILASLPARAEIDALSPVSRKEYDTLLQGHQGLLAKATQPLAKLGAGYAAALEKRKAAATAAGKEDQVVAADLAIAAFAAGTPPDAESSDPELAKLAKVYLAEKAKLEPAAKAQEMEAWRKHRYELERLTGRLTENDKAGDLKIVQAQIAATNRKIGVLEGKPQLPEGWDGEWQLDYNNKQRRLLKITATEPTVLKIEILSSSYSRNATYTATLDEDKGCFIAEHTEGPGGAQRWESYTLEGERILVRHWNPPHSYEKPDVQGTARRKE